MPVRQCSRRKRHPAPRGNGNEDVGEHEERAEIRENHEQDEPNRNAGYDGDVFEQGLALVDRGGDVPGESNHRLGVKLPRVDSRNFRLDALVKFIRRKRAHARRGRTQQQRVKRSGFVPKVACREAIALLPLVFDPFFQALERSIIGVRFELVLGLCGRVIDTRWLPELGALRRLQFVVDLRVARFLFQP